MKTTIGYIPAEEDMIYCSAWEMKEDTLYYEFKFHTDEYVSNLFYMRVKNVILTFSAQGENSSSSYIRSREIGKNENSKCYFLVPRGTKINVTLIQD